MWPQKATFCGSVTAPSRPPSPRGQAVFRAFSRRRPSRRIPCGAPVIARQKRTSPPDFSPAMPEVRAESRHPKSESFSLLAGRLPWYAGKAFFPEKKKQATVADGSTQPRQAGEQGAYAYRQKFFGSFFQKRTLSFVFATFSHRWLQTRADGARGKHRPGRASCCIDDAGRHPPGRSVSGVLPELPRAPGVRCAAGRLSFCLGPTVGPGVANAAEPYDWRLQRHASRRAVFLLFGR